MTRYICPFDGPWLTTAEIVHQLREERVEGARTALMPGGELNPSPICQAAADEIERLTSALKGESDG